MKKEITNGDMIKIICPNIKINNIDEYIKTNFQQVENKAGYVWFNKRNMQIISIDILKESIEDWINKGVRYTDKKESEE